MIATPKAKPKKFTYFIGIDVSKNELDYAVMHNKQLLFHLEAKNEPDSILAFITELKALPRFTLGKAIFCVEDTGIYCNHLRTVFNKLKAHISIQHPLHIKKSLGLVRDKSDKADAVRIADFAQKNRDELALWVPKRPVIAELADLVALRNRLSSVGVTLKTPLSAQVNFVNKALQHKNIQFCKNSTLAINADLAIINLSIEKLINADKRLKRLKQLITSVAGVGMITAVQMIISTNEFIDFKDPKKFACYAGVAPFGMESGMTARKGHVSHHANKKVKSLLHICAVKAIQCDSELRTYYQRKTQKEGKAKMTVINAVRSKLILRIFACVNQDRLFEKSYTRENKFDALENVAAVQG